MFKNQKLGAIFILSFVLFTICTTTFSNANSAEPPSILIIVPNAPKDLEISLIINGTSFKGRKEDKKIEAYYTFYARDISITGERISGNTNRFNISTGGSNYNIDLDDNVIAYNKYNNIYTLDLKEGTLVKGELLSRNIKLVSIRITTTLIIESIVFYLFGFRNKKSWIAFLIINLITQGALNTWINGFSPIIGTYIVFALIFAEILILIAEWIGFVSFVKEQNKWKTAGYVFVANMISFILGGYIIMMLPI